jgi:hypothetical protein
MKKLAVYLLPILLLFSFGLKDVYADKGVGIATGTITVDEDLMSGMSYNLPSVTIMNTGDEISSYGVGVAYHQNQKEHLVPKDWVTFSPSIFVLDPGKSQVVDIKLEIPITDVIPGDYFCYLEGFPKTEAGAGETSIGIAAAAKLYFTIAPSNIFEAIYYKTLSIWEEFYPWSLIVVIIVALFILITIIKKLFNIELNISRKDNTKNE